MTKTIGIIGAGNMGAAILQGVRKKYKVRICEKDKRRAQNLKRKHRVAIDDLKTLTQKSKIIILAVKPQGIDEVLKEMRSLISSKTLVISIAAGITTRYIEKRLGTKAKVIRTMPNLPAQIQQGVTAICRGRRATRQDLVSATKILENIGATVIVEEKWIDAITAVSGSGPAYVFLFVECLNQAAERLGLKKDLSQKLVLQTLKGSLNLLEQRGESPEVLRAQVTSKGGTTQAAMEVFQGNRIEKIFCEALLAAKKRAKKLAK